ncbi:AlbA family DNA-binding domain-containing protein [Listeria portnoyi]|uniref:AlbA family DNA-binding domain-containing protein n=1 Tax=Listeria portnoyi TaxID=2713504 RepID=UPI001C9C3761|nr:ATP-binding protein [Listeria portnoyi]
MQNFELKNESVILEYKESRKQLSKDFWETYSAFANTKGGLVVLGVKEKKHENRIDYQIVGVENTEKIIAELFTSLNNPQKVNYNVINDDNVSTREIDGMHIIEVRVNEAPTTKKPVYINNNIKHTFKRSNEGDMKVSDTELRSFLRNAEDDLDSELLKGYTMDDLDYESIVRYKDIVGERDLETDYLTLSNEEFLMTIGAMRRYY